ncbi:MAG: Rpn family recombination-promoting nuclease/putative transposase [Okeania sp. SIO2H7]|nr:Rpn family recombination-promoting nuclease/putative transposase [Okeania sp. SIO2H7]
MELLNLLEAIVIAKLPKLSRQELEIMFGVEDLRKTRFAQELMEEATLKIIPRLLSKGFSIEEIAEILQLNAQQVREYINKMN